MPPVVVGGSETSSLNVTSLLSIPNKAFQTASSPKMDTSGKKKFASRASGCTRRSRRFGRNLLNSDAACHGTVRPDAAATAYAFCTRSVRAFAFWTQRVSSIRRMSWQIASGRRLSRHHASGRGWQGDCVRTQLPWHMPSGRGVSGHSPSRRNACLTDAECQGKCLPYEVCQGICHPDAARVLQTQSVKANVVRTTHATASAFWTRSVRPFAIRTHRVSYRRRVSWQFFPDGACQGKCRLDKAYDGVPHIGNRAVTVIASRHDCHGTVHCSEDYQTCIWFQAL